MSGTIDIDHEDYLFMQLGGKPEITYHLYWRGDSFLLDHGGSIFIEQAISRIELAMKKMREEYGLNT